MQRIIDPVLADFESEYQDSVRTGAIWRSRWLYIIWYFAFFKTVAAQGGRRVMDVLHEGYTGDDRRVVIRTLAFCLTSIAFGTALLAMGPLLKFASKGNSSLALYFVPQVLPFSIPVGLTLGILWGVGGRRVSYRSCCLIMFVAVLASMMSFLLLAWVVPATNFAFRAAIAEVLAKETTNGFALTDPHRPLAAITDQRLTLSFSTGGARALAMHYHSRWALACGPFVLALFALSIIRRGVRGKFPRGLAGCAALAGYYTMTYLARDGSPPVPAFGAAWAPNVTFLLCAALMSMTSRGPIPGLAREPHP